MARAIHRLNAIKVRTVTVPGMYSDGGNLWLQVSRSGAKSWIFRYTRHGRAREMGLGSAAAVNLADARGVATDCRNRLASGLDPIQHRDATVAAAQLAAMQTMTFKQCAEAYITAQAPGWRNEKHISQWRNTLRDYVYPMIGELPVGSVDTGLVLRILEPIWALKTETATRLRARIEAILDWATVRQYRTGANPARWKGHLKHLLPNESKVAVVRHHPALPFVEFGAFMERLRAQPGTAARSLEFTILTATRTSETLNAEWAEIDLSLRLWTIPGARMKAGRDHRVPLSLSAVRVLEGVRRHREGRFVFPAVRSDRPLSTMAMLKVLQRMSRADITVHGFRSAFRDWAAEATPYSQEIAEMALAHAITNKVEAAYRRGDLFQKRARMMEDWGIYCDAPAPHVAEVIPLKNVA